MQWIVPFAAPPTDDAAVLLRNLALPRLAALLQRLHPAGREGGADGDELGPTPPHERALARALGWHGAAGRLPWAARLARADGVDVGDLAWGLMTPAHWHLGTEQVSLLDPALLALDEPASHALFDAVAPLFRDQGWLARWGAPLRWYLAHESLAGLACASLDRVVGRNVDAWLGADPAARSVRRLQAEVQMLLHAHPLNAAREAAGLLPVNSFWLSGCGVAQPEPPQPVAVLEERLRGPALQGDWAGWARAWLALDAELMPALQQRLQAGQPVALTLCGERGSATWSSAGPAGLAGVLAGLRARWAAPAPSEALAGL
jgi:hypothetical protein